MKNIQFPKFGWSSRGGSLCRRLPGWRVGGIAEHASPPRLHQSILPPVGFQVCGHRMSALGH